MQWPRQPALNTMMGQLVTQTSENAKDVAALIVAVKALGDQVAQLSTSVQVQHNATTNQDQRINDLTARVVAIEDRERKRNDQQDDRWFSIGMMRRNWALTYGSLAVGGIGLLIEIAQHWH